jgi:hypothetical protein
MQEIKPLTSLRGIAALAVVLQHFSTARSGLSSRNGILVSPTIMRLRPLKPRQHKPQGS